MQVRQWTHSENPANTDAFAPPHPFHYTSFDGKRIPAFFYKPEALEGNEAGGVKVPVVVYIHGGPGMYSLTSLPNLVCTRTCTTLLSRLQ